MKTNLRRVSKRTLALFLGILMLITSIGVGTMITAGAADYYLWYGTSDNPTGYNSKVELSLNSSGYYSGSFSNPNSNVFFLINTSSSAHTTSSFNSSTTYEFKGGFADWSTVGTYGSTYIAKFYVSTSSASTIYVGYNPSTNKLIVSSNASDVGGSGSGGNTGGDTGSTDKWYVHGEGSGLDWTAGTEMKSAVFEGKTYWYFYATEAIKFKITDIQSGWGNDSTRKEFNGWHKQSPLTGNDGDNIELSSNNAPTYIITNGEYEKQNSVWTNDLPPEQWGGTTTEPTTPSTPGYDASQLKMDDYDLEHTWINAKGASVDNKYLYTNVVDIALKKAHSSSGYSYYVAVVKLEGKNNTYYYTSSDVLAAADYQDAKPKFTVQVGNLPADVYEVSVNALAFKTKAEAEAVKGQTQVTSYNKGNGVLADNGVFLHDANRTLTVSNDTNPLASVTARLDVNGTGEGNTLTYEKDDTVKLELHAYSNNGNTAVNTAVNQIAKTSAKSYEYQYYYVKNKSNSDTSGTPVLLATAYDNAPAAKKVVTQNTVTKTLGDIKDLKDGDVLHFYVLITGYSDIAHRNAITYPGSSADKGYINVSVSSLTDKSSVVAGSSDLWVDTAPQSSDINTLVKWNNKQGPSASSTSTYYFYLPKNDNVSLSSLVFYYDSSKLSNVTVNGTQ
ncbi:MAG: hypothetical protein J1E41_07340, partial [Ruminococcus sp.]|nr:hypothetical protein [Ruminococcus sp.]